MACHYLKRQKQRASNTMNRRQFDDTAYFPPNVLRDEVSLLGHLIDRSDDQDIFFYGARGYGTTKVLEELRNLVDSRSDTSDRGDRPWVFAVIDLAAVGQVDLVPLLLSVRNRIVQRVESDGRNPDAELRFVLFDLIAGLIWKRRHTATSIPLVYYRTGNRRLGAAALKILKGFALGEAVEATGEVTGLGGVFERVFDKATEALASKLSEQLSDIAKNRMGAELFSELRKKRPSLSVLEDALPFVFADAVRKIARGFEKRLSHNISPSFVIAVDAADACSELTFDEYELRRRLCEALLPLADEKIAKVIIAGRNSESELDEWKQPHRPSVDVNLPAFKRRSVEAAVAHLPDGSKAIILDATSPKDAECWVHPSAYAVAHKHIEEFDPAHPIESIREAVQALWGQGLTMPEFERSLVQVWPQVDRTTLDTLWRHPFWMSAPGRTMKRVPWYLRPLNADPAMWAERS